jgi:hypothetical protein
MIVHLNLLDLFIIVILFYFFYCITIIYFKLLIEKENIKSHAKGYKKGVEDMNDLFKTFSEN